jgi:Brp/Blh family beta-carotene 15,15'-monooxygenase
MLHFSGDPAAGTPGLARVLYGGAIIVLPTLLHAEEITRLFSLLVGIDAATLVTPFLRLLAWPWLIGLAMAAIQRLPKDWLTALEMGAVAVLAVLAPPLISFTVFFCAMHSARHILRTIDYSGRTSPGLILGATLLPMLGVLIASAAAWHFLAGTPINGAIIQLVFVGLAALTVPHMALVERVRLSGWVTGSASRRI